MIRRIAQLAVGAFSLVATDAAAAVYSVGARTEAQAYQFRSWQGRSADDPYLISRYRLVQYLDLGAFDLSERARDAGGRVDFVSSLRLDYDFGSYADDRNLLDDAAQPALHLLYAYVQWSGALGGWLDLRLGRQIRLDALEFFSFDGLDVTVHTPAYLGVGIFGGWQVKGAGILSSPTFAPGGVRVSDRRRIDAGAPTDLLSDPAAEVAYDYLDAPSPIFGARLLLENVRDVEAGLFYRRAMSRTRGANLEALPEEARGWQIDQEHGGAAGRVRLFHRWDLYGSADRDLFRQRWAALRAGTRVEVIPYRLSLTGEARRYQPSFDADSIWNLFSSGARDDYLLRADGEAGEWLWYAGPLLTAFHLDLSEDYAAEAGVKADGVSLLYGGLAGIGLKPNRPWRLAADVLYRGGPSGERNHPDTLGRQLWFTGVAGRSLFDRHGIDLRLSVANISDPNVAALDDLWSFGAALIGRIGLSDEASITLVVEENVNRLVTSDLRGYAVLDVRTLFR